MPRVTEPRESLLQKSRSGGGLIFLAALSALIGGAGGVAMVALMLWFDRKGWVVDSANSHGISEVQSSRLGGVAVFFGAFAFFFFAEWALSAQQDSQDLTALLIDQLPSYLAFAFLIALVGLWDDFVSRFQPLARLVLVLAVSICALTNNTALLQASAFDWLPFGLNNHVALVLAGAFIVTGFVNAGNMADGANGLLGVISTSFFVVLMFYDKAVFAPSIIMALLIFLLFNIATGRIFLGDFGAYGLSAMIAFGSLDLYSSGSVSIWYLGCMLAYPCLEMFRVIITRFSAGGSPLESANDHVHNYLYESLRGRGWNRIVSNSLTGCLLALASAALPASIIIFGVVEGTNGSFWLIYFIVYAGLHLNLALLLKQKNSRRNRLV